MERRILSLHFPHLAAERMLRQKDLRGPMAVVAMEKGTLRVVCACPAAAESGIAEGMGLADARAIIPALATAEADPHGDAALLDRILQALRRFAPLVARDGARGLTLDITGAAHLFGGEAALAAEVQAQTGTFGLTARIAVAETQAGARALALFTPQDPVPVIAPGKLRAAVAALPVAALESDGVPAEAVQSLRGLGQRRVGDVLNLPRAPLARRFGTQTLAALERMTGAAPGPISPEPELPPFAARMRCPEPIGLTPDVTGVAGRLAERVCAHLAQAGMGARRVRMQLWRVDHTEAAVEIGFAYPTRDPKRIIALLAPHLGVLDAGFGFETFRLEAVETEPLNPTQIGVEGTAAKATLDDLITKLGNQLGFDRVLRFHPAESHIPELSFTPMAASVCEPAPDWPMPTLLRPLQLFPPEPVIPEGRAIPPRAFTWRRMCLTTRSAKGPERIAQEWWWDDPNWRTGARDYWVIQTAEGRRLWLFATMGAEQWWAAGEFA